MKTSMTHTIQQAHDIFLSKIIQVLPQKWFAILHTVKIKAKRFTVT